MSTLLRIGMIGLDTSHAPAFANLLHHADDPYHIPGMRVTIAFPGGSPDFPTSINRLEGFTNELRDKHQVRMVDSIAALRDECDVIFLHSVDGRVHLDQFRQLADWGKPVFIDKPFTVASGEAREICRLAAEKGTRILTASAIRYAEAFRQTLREGAEEGAITGGDFYGPLTILDQLPGYFWYGIHTAELLYAVFGKGCREVLARRIGGQDIILGTWGDGRFGTIRGNRTGNNGFGGTIHREKKSRAFDVSTSSKPYYASLLEEIRRFIDGEEVIDPEESVEIIRFLEAANESVATGCTVAL